MLLEKNLVMILDSLRAELKKFCKRTARRCHDFSYTWEDFFQIAAMGIWKQFKLDARKGKKRRTKEYAHRGKWAIYDELDKINAHKRDKRKMGYDEQYGIRYIK